MKKVVIIRGLPGSGKSTMAMKHFVDLKGYKHCEADHYFYNNGVYEFKPAELAKAHEYCLNKAASFIENGHKVVIANTFSKKWEIKEVLDRLPVDPREVEILHCHGGKGSIHDVPEYAIENMRQRWFKHPRERHVTLDFTNARPRVIAYQPEPAL